MSVELPASLRATLDERVAHEQLRLADEQAVRVLGSMFLLDTFLVWLLARAGLLWPAVAWVLVGAVLQAGRWFLGRQHRDSDVAAGDVSRRLAWMFALIGAERAAIVPLLFSQPIVDVHYVFTMVMVGQMAGAVGSVAGMFRAYVMWGAPIAGVAAAAWWMQGSFGGRWVAVLLLLLFAALADYVKKNGATLRQLVEFAHKTQALASSLAAERDRAREASRANEMLAESLRIERNQAEAASQSKTRFFAAASHDLRQPLHALSINATTLELVARKQNDPVIRELSQSINRALQQSNGLLEGLLDISRLDAGTVDVTLEAVDASDLLATLLDEFQASAAQAGLKLSVDAPAAGRLWIRTDADLMLRVLNNLVSNALKFTAQGSVHVYARERDAGEGSPCIALGVEDTGCGIPPAEQERVFEEFYQIGNPSRDRSQGLGLGLSIVKRSASLLGAGLTLRSAQGQGTCIELRVPRSAPPAREAAHAPSADDTLDDSAPLDARVLAIDDEPEILRSLAGLLPELGCEIRCADSLAEAQCVLDSGFVPQLLLVDHRLRNETGTHCIEQLRLRLGAVPAVLVTGDTEPKTMQHALSSGCRVIHKPLDGTRLAQAIGQAIAQGSALNA